MLKEVHERGKKIQHEPKYSKKEEKKKMENGGNGENVKNRKE